ncbi:MAG: U32 family peptidase, partial [Treponema sp.]|nr:U32 family peptidase [Treponema sp.]
IPEGFQVGDEVYLLQTKSMSKRYNRVLPEDLSSFSSQPGAEKLPILDLIPLPKGGLSYFPAGLYIAVSTTQDAHIVQTARPVRTIVELNNETEYDFLHKDTKEKPLFPTGRRQLFIALDPFLPEGGMEHFKQVLAVLLEKGYTNFIVNNLAQLELLKGKGTNLIAGPYLYSFNRWSASFLENQDVMAFQMPYENSEANLSKTFASKEERSRVLVPLFAYPVLFRMRFKLPASYDFTFFSDKQGIPFKVNSTPDGSFVMPELPFSIIEKTDQLKNAGFDRQLLDFTKTKVGKGDIKNLLNFMSRHDHVSDSSKFNWKDGFFDQEKMEAYKAVDERRAMEARYTGADSKSGSGVRGSAPRGSAPRGSAIRGSAVKGGRSGSKASGTKGGRRR